MIGRVIDTQHHWFPRKLDMYTTQRMYTVRYGRKHNPDRYFWPFHAAPRRRVTNAKKFFCSLFFCCCPLYPLTSLKKVPEGGGQARWLRLYRRGNLNSQISTIIFHQKFSTTSNRSSMPTWWSVIYRPFKEACFWVDFFFLNGRGSLTQTSSDCL